MVRPSALLPAEFEGAIEHALTPGGRKVIDIVVVGGASRIIALYEGPIAIGVKQEETFAASVVDVEDEAGVLRDPTGELGELGRLVKVTVAWEHGVVW
jgi:hypothetical protein